MSIIALGFALSLATIAAPAKDSASRWTIEKDGGIRWTVHQNDKPHEDHIEMSGRKVSFILRYGTTEGGKLNVQRTVVWPMLRTIPNNTHASLAHDFGDSSFPSITVNDQPVGDEQPYEFTLRGMLTIKSRTSSGLEITRTLFPSTTKPMVIENCTLRNTTGKMMKVEIGPLDKQFHTDPEKGVYGEYILSTQVVGAKSINMRRGATTDFSIIFSGSKKDDPADSVDPTAEQQARKTYVECLWSKLVFDSPDPVLNREFAFCKVRAAESIFETKGGLLHGPGGGSYYAAIWANDQAEYANPFFPYLGDATGNESALTSYRLFGRYMKSDYSPVPSSIIAEGMDIWNGAGDRGDAAMIAYGAARYALASGDEKTADQMWPIIEWCLEYCRRKTNTEGVITSNFDELEGRFPAGDANLCTSSLAYDALRSAVYLGEELGKPESVINDYKARAESLRTAIGRHFGATVDGFRTYRYYNGNTTLRAWICIPLTMGIFDRSDGTVSALFSPKLWTDDGLASEAGKETFWDRSTLYALRGVFAAGDTERALEHLQFYSHRRLLEEHVPYPVEAWPEGGQRHLSAESALYCRVITEGLFGIRPTGLRSFDITPRLPEQWNHMALKGVHAFGNVFDVVVSRRDGRVRLDVTSGGKTILREWVKSGEAVAVKLPR